jgi:hypothetical protein
MHGKRALARSVYYGADRERLYLRVDFEEEATKLEGLEIHVHREGAKERDGVVKIEGGAAVAVRDGRRGAKRSRIEAAFKDVLEIAVPLLSENDRVSLSFWQDGLPVAAIPAEGSFQAGDTSVWSA